MVARARHVLQLRDRNRSRLVGSSSTGGGCRRVLRRLFHLLLPLALPRCLGKPRPEGRFTDLRSQPFSVLQLGPGQFLLSPDTYFKLTMRRDGDLVVSSHGMANRCGRAIPEATQAPTPSCRSTGTSSFLTRRGAHRFGRLLPRAIPARGSRYKMTETFLSIRNLAKSSGNPRRGMPAYESVRGGTGQDGEPRTGILASTRGVRRRRNGCTDSIGTGLRGSESADTFGVHHTGRLDACAVRSPRRRVSRRAAVSVSAGARRWQADSNPHQPKESWCQG